MIIRRLLGETSVLLVGLAALLAGTGAGAATAVISNPEDPSFSACYLTTEDPREANLATLLKGLTVEVAGKSSTGRYEIRILDVADPRVIPHGGWPHGQDAVGWISAHFLAIDIAVEPDTTAGYQLDTMGLEVSEFTAAGSRPEYPLPYGQPVHANSERFSVLYPSDILSPHSTDELGGSFGKRETVRDGPRELVAVAHYVEDTWDDDERDESGRQICLTPNAQYSTGQSEFVRRVEVVLIPAMKGVVIPRLLLKELALHPLQFVDPGNRTFDAQSVFEYGYIDESVDRNGNFHVSQTYYCTSLTLLKRNNERASDISSSPNGSENEREVSTGSTIEEKRVQRRREGYTHRRSVPQ